MYCYQQLAYRRYTPSSCFVDVVHKILYNCADLNAGDSTTVIVSVQSGVTNTTSPIALNGSDGSETDQSDSLQIVISTQDDIDILESILQTLLADCFTISEGSIKAGYDLNALIALILGNLTDKGGDLFGEHIHYFRGNNTLEAPPQWNGNVSWIEWRIAGEPYQAYGYQYDAANRLTQALYQSRISLCEETNANYDCYYGYDERGNIKTSG
jgi:hypothetical protein